MALVSQAEFARMNNVSRKTVTIWKKHGRLVLNGRMVDVEASKPLCQTLRTVCATVASSADTPELRSSSKDNSSPEMGNTYASVQHEGNDHVVTLSCAEISGRLRELDWCREFDWSETAQFERAKNAAACIGWVMVQSSLRDDGHWGGLQLRCVVGDDQDVVTVHDIIAGYGFELEPEEVIRLVRAEIEPSLELEGAQTADVRLSLLPVLAKPFYEEDRR